MNCLFVARSRIFSAWSVVVILKDSFYLCETPRVVLKSVKQLPVIMETKLTH
jgi:hypothetical protein